MSESRIVFGQMLDYFRKENNMTMEELGHEMGKTKSAVSRWISGDNYPKVDDIEKLSKLFNTDVETLVFGNTEKHIIAKITDGAMKLSSKRQEMVYDFVIFQLNQQEREG